MSKKLPQRLVDDSLGKVLLVFQDVEEREKAVAWLEEAGYDVLTADGKHEADLLIQRRLDLDVVIAERQFCLGDDSLLDAVELGPKGLEIILAGPADVFAVTHALAEGATSFLPHPLTQVDLLGQVLRALHTARQVQISQDRLLERPPEVKYEGIVGITPRMKEIMDVVRKAAPTDAPVVILGEAGTGKELIARAIHDNSPRRGGPFVALHLLATPQGLVESELFGHKKGAYTGATSDRVGKLELANGGTLFLDEMGDIPLETQAKLLRVLETRTFEPVGANKPVSSDFRLIAATNQDIESMIKEKTFREELWYRIKVVRIDLPPLRERRSDIPLLVDAFVKDAAERFSKEIAGVDSEVVALLSQHPWKGGNIRALRNAVQSMVVLADGPRITLKDVPREIRGFEVGADDDGEIGASLAGRTMDEIEREAIRETLQLTGGNRKQAADLLQIGERTLYRKIEKYGL